MSRVFVHTNNKQLLGAKLAQYAIEKNLKDKNSLKVEIINVDEVSAFKNFAGKTYHRKGRKVVYNPNDLQSFTLSRFMPPQLMDYQERAIVIDPDIFALTDINELINIDLRGYPVAACSKKDAWDSSVMVMDCAKLKHWDINKILDDLHSETADYDEWMTLRKELVLPLPREWNSLDHLTEQTKLLHTTDRLTQPWKTGLPIDFTRNPTPKLFGLIPREPILTLLGKYPTSYQPHPDKKIEQFFINLAKDALTANVFDKEFLQGEIEKQHVRRDLLQLIS